MFIFLLSLLLNDYTPAHFANIYLNLGEKKWEKLLMQAMEYYSDKEEKKWKKKLQEIQ